LSDSAELSLHQLTPDDVTLLQDLLTTFGEAFDEAATYGGNRPGAAYLQRLLGSDYFIVLTASRQDRSR
jgi:aminoglycoside 3-N-acetyltransferase I